MVYIDGLWVFIASAFIISSLIFLSFRSVKIPLMRCFIALMMCAFIWNLFFVFELASTGLDKKLVFARIQYIGIALLPLAWLSLSTLLAEVYIPRTWWVVLWVIPLVTLSIVWFAPMPNIFWGVPKLVPTSTNFVGIDYDYQFWFYAILIPFMYILITIAIILIARKLGRSQKVYRKQLGLVVIGAIIPLAANLLYVFGPSPYSDMNYATASLSITSLMYGWALFRYKFLDLVPIARDKIVEQMSDAVVVLDKNRRVVDFNYAASQLVRHGRPPLGSSLAQLGLEELDDTVFRVQGKDKPNILVTLKERMFEVNVQQITKIAPRMEATLVTLHDVTEREDLYRKVRELALTDSLTGLNNRRALFEQAENLIQEVVVTHRKPMAAIMFDIDNFKAINDKYGHTIGDRVLAEVARRSVDTLRREDIIGRLGGDEYVIIIPDISYDDAMALATTLHDRIGMLQIQSDETAFSVSISAGVGYSSKVTAREPNQFLERLISIADNALYQAKAQGKNCVRGIG